MKDRIGNTLGVGDKVVCALPEAQIFGFVVEATEAEMKTKFTRDGGLSVQPGRVLVNAVIAWPVDPQTGMVLQVVKVHDAQKDNAPVASDGPVMDELPERTN